jgi:hypothetical protein
MTQNPNKALKLLYFELHSLSLSNMSKEYLAFEPDDYVQKKTFFKTCVNILKIFDHATTYMHRRQVVRKVTVRSHTRITRFPFSYEKGAKSCPPFH